MTIINICNLFAPIVGPLIGIINILFYSIPYASYFFTSGFKRLQKNAHTFTI